MDILVRAYWEEKDKIEKSKKDLYSKERECYFNEVGWRLEAIKELREESKNTENLVRERYTKASHG